MKNLTPYNKDCFEFHKTAVDKKNISNSKDRLISINPEVEKVFLTFEQLFLNKKLDTLKPNSYFDVYKDDLKSLYRFQSAVIRTLREDIKQLQVRTIINTCQNCTIDTANTLDHILPQGKYPEFVVNPKNLFPCCSTCNSYKFDKIKENENNRFLNLYLDELPLTQYLFVKIFLDYEKELDFKFYIKNYEQKIEPSFFSIIENHYIELHLFERMRLKSIEYISEIENKIITFSKRLTIEQIKEDIIETIEKDKLAYGFNYWKCILEGALIDSDIFIEKIKKIRDGNT